MGIKNPRNLSEDFLLEIINIYLRSSYQKDTFLCVNNVSNNNLKFDLSELTALTA